MSIDNVLKVTEEEKCTIAKAYGKSEDEIKQDVKAIREWMKKQPHLPANIDNHFIERKLFWNKYSLEKSKKKIDMHYSIRNLVPEFFDDWNLTSPRCQRHMDSILILPLPKLTTELSRVTIFSFLNSNPENFDVNFHMKYISAVTNFRFLNDTFLSDIYIIDLGNATIAHMLKTNLVTFKKAHTVLQKAYSDILVAIHYVNVPSYAETFVTMVKSVMKVKIAKRIFVHKNYESLHQMVAPEILPVEYGGTERSVAQLHADWRTVLEKNNDTIMEMAAERSNEKLRLGEPLGVDVFDSIHGSFRQLAVD